MQGKDFFDDVPDAQDLQERWQLALRNAVRRGWEIEQLWRLDRNVDRSLRLVGTMLDLVGSGRYHLRYFERYGTLRPPYDLVVVPGVAAMMLLATGNPDHVDGTLVLTDPGQIETVRAHFAQLRALTRPLLHGYLPPTYEIQGTRRHWLPARAGPVAGDSSRTASAP
jgi:hypothetical protein